MSGRKRNSLLNPLQNRVIGWSTGAAWQCENVRNDVSSLAQRRLNGTQNRDHPVECGGRPWSQARCSCNDNPPNQLKLDWPAEIPGELQATPFLGCENSTQDRGRELVAAYGCPS